MTRRLVVIGGGAAGMSAASAARRADPDLDVTVLEEGPYPSYGVCGIPYFLGGVVADAASLIAHPVEEYTVRRRIDLRLGVHVAQVDVKRRQVVTGDGDLAYDALILATGAAPIVPDVPGVDHPRVVVVRRLEDAEALRAELPRVRRAVVVGAGYVGLEVAEALVSRGVAVTVADRLPRVLATVDPELAGDVADEVARHADLALDAPLRAITAAGDALRVCLGDATVETDLVVLALGVRPATSLLAAAGAELMAPGAVVVDDQQRASLPGVWAAGDCATARHQVTGRPAYVPLGPVANKAGRVAGTVAAGGQAAAPTIAGTAVTKVFDLTVAHTGLTLAAALDAGFDAVATDLTSRSRAKYYPGSAPLRTRLVHTRDGRLLGGQLVGADGAAKRVDVLATALYARLGVDDLAALDLAYAPPYAPVYDPVTQVAQAAQRALVAAAR